jgi:hypothetical protein
MQELPYPANTGTLSTLSDQEKKQRLEAMAGLWQRDTEHRLEREGYAAFIKSVGLDEYRYAVWLRFPEWERSAVIGQVIALPNTQQKETEQPVLFSTWRRDPLLRTMPDWKLHLPQENVFNIAVRLTPGGLGEGSKWAVIMPRELIARYKPGWPTQQEWVAWTRSFDWLAVAVGFVRAMLDA